jgi:2,3-dihydroxybiphenyl 1,2-dioxygenase
MAAVTQLGYLGIGVRDLNEWQSYATGVLGLGLAGQQRDGRLLLAMDARHHRFELLDDGRDDIAYIGWQTDTAEELAAIAARLEQAGVALSTGSREEAERRHVQGLIKFSDPDGYQVEVFHGPEPAAAPFASTKRDTSFVAGSQGLGHLVLATENLNRAMDFYVRLLGMKVSDYVAGPPNLGFLHCNPRHHSIAFVELASAKKRINHFMVQLDSIDSVGRTYDAVQDGSAPLLVTMGRHSNDEMVSFYMANPSKFGVEYGWGAREIDDRSWQIEHYSSGTLWGHKPARRGVPAPQT